MAGLQDDCGESRAMLAFRRKDSRGRFAPIQGRAPGFGFVFNWNGHWRRKNKTNIQFDGRSRQICFVPGKIVVHIRVFFSSVALVGLGSFTRLKIAIAGGMPPVFQGIFWSNQAWKHKKTILSSQATSQIAMRVTGRVAGCIVGRATGQPVRFQKLRFGQKRLNCRERHTVSLKKAKNDTAVNVAANC